MSISSIHYLEKSNSENVKAVIYQKLQNSKPQPNYELFTQTYFLLAESCIQNELNSDFQKLFLNMKERINSETELCVSIILS